jgi:hypothetical protein
MDGEEGTTKYAKGAKREAKLQPGAFANSAHFAVKSDFRLLIRNGYLWVWMVGDWVFSVGCLQRAVVCGRCWRWEERACI